MFIGLFVAIAIVAFEVGLYIFSTEFHRFFWRMSLYRCVACGRFGHLGLDPLCRVVNATCQACAIMHPSEDCPDKRETKGKIKKMAMTKGFEGFQEDLELVKQDPGGAMIDPLLTQDDSWLVKQDAEATMIGPLLIHKNWLGNHHPEATIQLTQPMHVQLCPFCYGEELPSSFNMDESDYDKCPTLNQRKRLMDSWSTAASEGSDGEPEQLESKYTLDVVPQPQKYFT